MIRTSYLLILALAIGCQGTKKDHPTSGGSCAPAADEAFVESSSESANKTTLANVETVSTAIAVTYDRTAPSGLQWSIKDNGLQLGNQRYELQYTEGHVWNVIGPNESLAGNLVPYRTENCATVSKLELTMFVPEETAAAYISYMKL